MDIKTSSPVNLIPPALYCDFTRVSGRISLCERKSHQVQLDFNQFGILDDRVLCRLEISVRQMPDSNSVPQGFRTGPLADSSQSGGYGDILG